jgi:hypothetical protein
MPLPTITRPNGTTYHPRHIRTQLLGPLEEAPETCVVLGTTDYQEALAAARLDVAAHNKDWGLEGEHDIGHLVLEEGTGRTVWYRKKLSHFDDGAPWHFYITDPVHGAGGIEFDVHEYEGTEADT